MNLMRKLVAAALLAILTAGLVQAEPEKGEPIPPPAKAPVAGRLTNDKLKEMLVNLGYNPQERKSTTGNPMFHVEMTRDGWDYRFYVSLSGDGTQLWLTSYLGDLPDARDIPVERLEKLLAATNDVGPCHFSLKGRKIYLNRAIENQNVTPGQLRGVVDEFNDRIKETKDVWNVANWTRVEATQTIPMKEKK
jgi:hypothetical protein